MYQIRSLPSSTRAQAAIAEPHDILDRIRLLRSRRVGPATWRRLMNEHGCAADAVAALSEVARAAGIDGYAPCPPAIAEREWRDGSRAGAVPLFCDDQRYPPALAAIGDAPPLLWVRGDVAALSRPAVAIIGARAASSLGERMARRMGTALSERGVCIVSGLARGIDAAAHAAALDAGGRTVAVLAGGVDVVYPAENAALAARIAAVGGAVISEAPIGRTARAADFPRRNRIVSGLSRGVVVVEAALKSGSLSTARLAAEQGREVMAVPGHPFEARAAGPNALIRDGATLVMGPDQVVEALGGTDALRIAPPDSAAPVRPPVRDATDGIRPSPPVASAKPSRDVDAGADDVQERIRSILQSPMDEDGLIRAVGLAPAALAPVLLAMELEGRVERLPGARLVAR